MEKIYIFDVDGTLTPSRGHIDKDFKEWFIEFCKKNRVCLVTGSDYEKTLEQLDKEVLDVVEFSFNCSGNALYMQHELIHASNWKCPDDLWLFLENELYQSPYAYKLGRHFEERTGMLNFSIVGRAAQGKERSEYYEWDKGFGERIRLANTINNRWPDIQAAVGGETGIDIFKKGTDKSQILNYLKSGELIFFGDRMDPSGNDYTLSKAIIDSKRGSCYNITNWSNTWKILRSLCPNV